MALSTGGSAALPLPVFPSHQSHERESPGSELCASCFLYSRNGGVCGGCDCGYQRRCLKRRCRYGCATCAGGRHASTYGVCGSAAALWPSWRDQLQRLLEAPGREYAPPPLPILCPLIPVITTQVRQHRLAESCPGIDAWAVPLHRVADRQGRFRSRDLKDYLGLPAGRKLILSTCAPDDYQEMLWSLGERFAPARHGVDYWFPAHFSIYDNDSKMYQFTSAKRQQIHAALTHSQFVWFRLGETIPVDFLAPIRGAANVLISTQQMYSRHNRAILAAEVRIADGWFEPATSFFVVGRSRGLPIGAGRRRYEVNSRWLLAALRGRDLTNLPRPQWSRAELLLANLKEALHDAERELA